MLKNCSNILKDPSRLQALAKTELMDSPEEEAFQRLNRLASLALKAPVSIFSVIGEDKQYFKSVVGLPAEIGPGTSFPLDVSVCMYALHGLPLNIEDTQKHPAFIDNESVKNLNIGGYLGMPLITKGGHAIGTVCVFDHKARIWTNEEVECLSEITNTFLTEIELRHALSDAKEEVRTREEFISIASHEIKTPLSVLILESQLAHLRLKRQELSPERLVKLLNQFDRQFYRLKSLVENMLDVSRIKTGKLVLDPKIFSLNNLIKNILQDFSSQLSLSGCEVSCQANLEVNGEWDPIRVEQVITNLLSNIVKYASGAPVEIRLYEEDEYVHISVADNGPGLPQDVLEKVFLPFERFHNEKSASGLGIGLFISFQIMKAHGGSLKVESELGKGTCFTMLLPKSF
jgi:signal transduction histidine kinase